MLRGNGKSGAAGSDLKDDDFTAKASGDGGARAGRGAARWRFDPVLAGLALCILASLAIFGFGEWVRLAGVAGREATLAAAEANRELRLKVERLRGELDRSLTDLTQGPEEPALRDTSGLDRSAEGLIFIADTRGRLIHQGPVFRQLADMAGFPWPAIGKAEIRPAADLRPWMSDNPEAPLDDAAVLVLARKWGYAGRFIHREALIAPAEKPLASGPVAFHWKIHTREGALLADWGNAVPALLPGGAAARPGPGGLEIAVTAANRGIAVPILAALFAVCAGSALWALRRRRHQPVGVPDAARVQPGYWKAQETIRQLQTRLEASERALANPAEYPQRGKPPQLAALAHELRTPLNAILGFSEMMDRELMGPLGHETYRDYARSIQESGQTLANRVEDVLALAELDAGERRLAPCPGDVTAPVLTVATELAEQAKARGVRMMFGKRAGVWANIDASALQEGVGLFLAAQLEDTPAGGNIRIETVRAGAGGGPVLLRLSDTGVGRLALVAETAPGTTPPSGALSPLRLTLARRLLEAMGSTVEIRSVPRRGNEVRIWLANAQAPGQRSDAA